MIEIIIGHAAIAEHDFAFGGVDGFDGAEFDRGVLLVRTMARIGVAIWLGARPAVATW
jgi:hypothetical protein